MFSLFLKISLFNSIFGGFKNGLFISLFGLLLFFNYLLINLFLFYIFVMQLLAFLL